MITLPTSTASDIFGIAGGVFTDLMPLILLIIGLSIGLWIISRLFGLGGGNNDDDDDDDDDYSSKRSKKSQA